MGGQVSSQKWDDLINADFEKQKKIMQETSPSDSVSKTETQVSAPKKADASSVNKTETKASSAAEKQNETKAADTKPEKEVKKEESKPKQPSPPPQPHAPKVKLIPKHASCIINNVQICKKYSALSQTTSLPSTDTPGFPFAGK